MRLSLLPLTFAGLLLAFPAVAQANLLRNGDFQDDWITLLPQNKNHHWCYSSEFYNRRDFNPDSWSCKGGWRWQDAGAPRGQRRLVLRGPQSSVSQRVNGVLVHDDRVMAAWPTPAASPPSARSAVDSPSAWCAT